MKIGLLGGSFDPVHFGHLLAAQDACEQFQLERIVLVPAARAPLKPEAARASAADRLALLQAAVAGDARFEVSDFELRRGGVSYSIDTARHFRGLYPGGDLHWIIGADQLPALPQWKEIAELAALVQFIVLERPGFPSSLRPEIPGLRLHRCDGHRFAVSSSELRERARLGLPLDYFIPARAAALIRDKDLYPAEKRKIS